MKRILLLAVATVAALSAQGQPKQAFLVTTVNNITTAYAFECGGVAGCLDNRSTFQRRNVYHSFSATGPGSWSVTMEYADGAPTGFTSFGSTAVVTQSSNPNIGFGNGYHDYLLFSISGANAATVQVTYGGSGPNLFFSSSVGSISFPIAVAQGGTGVTAAQGVGDSKVELAGTNSGAAGAPLCNDALGGATTAGCSPTLPVGTQTQVLQIQPNAGNSTTYQWANKPEALVPDFNFPAQTPGGSLSIGADTITLFPMPLGITASSVASGGINKHYLYISGGSGTAEAVPIVGWSSTTVTVTCANTHSGAWTIQSAAGGVQETINYAWANALAVGWHGSAFNQGNTQETNANIYGPIYTPPGWGNVIDIQGVNFTVLLTSQWTSYDAWTFDTFDFCTYIIGNQIYWPGQPNGSAIFRFNPQNANGEVATGQYTSTIRFGVVVPAHVDGSPGTQGYAIRISSFSPSANTGGVKFEWDQINGGQVGLYIDTPTSTYGVGGCFFKGYIDTAGLASVQAGASSTTKINNNIWDLTGYAGTTAYLISYGTSDLYRMAAGGPGDGVQFKAGSSSNVVIGTLSVGGTSFNNSGVGNRFYTGGATQYVTPSVGASPWTYQNLTGRPLSMLVSGATISAIAVSFDGSSFVNTTSPPTNTFLTIQPDMYLKVTYTGSVTVVGYQ